MDSGNPLHYPVNVSGKKFKIVIRVEENITVVSYPSRSRVFLPPFISNSFEARPL